MGMPPVVYVGPTLEAAGVKEWLPEAQVMPPVRRGDLYRDRLLGFGLFLILDGVFFDELAISPREVIDVIRDDGIVVGASSMGAIRAAECWPVGMRGLGSIYRMYRRGSLTSDDEVAVAFSPFSPCASATVPLVTVRYALSRVARNGTLAKAEANRIARAAADLHYAERTWTSILQSAGVVDHDERLSTALRTYDLKRKDAIRALKRVRTWIDDSPGLLKERSAKPQRPAFVDRAREAWHGVTGPESKADRADLWRWLLASGRYRRYAGAALGAMVAAKWGVDASPASTPGQRGAEAAEVEAYANAQAWTSSLGIGPTDLASALAHRQGVVQRLATVAHDSVPARAIWAEISVAGDMDAIVLRFTALKNAARWARARSFRPDVGQRQLALQEIAYFHGFRTWATLRSALGPDLLLWSWIEHTAEEMALAKRIRYELFRGTGQARNC
jgi:hypothetical protein